MNLELTHFDSLDFSKQRELIRKSPHSEKGDLILRSEKPEEIVPVLSHEDFLILLNETGKELHPDLLRHATSNQLTFATDFLCWEKDEIHKDRFLEWIDALLQADRDKLLVFLSETDIEFLISGFMKFVEVFKTEHLQMADDYIGDQPFFTLDQLYYINITGDHFESMRQAIEILFESDRALYVNLLESIIAEDESMIQEEAYQLRNNRLSEFGFPDKEEAMRIYKPIVDWASIETKEANFFGDKPIEKPQSTFPILREHAPLFLDKVLTRFYQKYPHDEQLEFEFLSLTNKILSCEDLPFHHVQGIRNCLTRARKWVSLSLEELSQSKEDKALELLETQYIESFFRWSMTLLRKLRKEVEQTLHELHFQDITQFFHFLSNPWNTRLSGLFRMIPIKAKANAEMEVQEFEDFESLAEIHRFHIEIQELRDILEFLALHNKATGANFVNSLKKTNTEITFLLLMATSVIHQTLYEKISFEPLEEKEIKEFIRTAFDDQKPFRKLRPTVKQHFLKILPSPLENNHVIELLFNRLEEELGGLNLKMKLDPKYLPILLVKSY